MIWSCPNGCNPDRVLVCGGATPWFNHGNEDPDMPNIYFFGEMPEDRSEYTYTKEAFTPTPFELTPEDWWEMHDHADGGCCSEPQCAECLEFMVPTEVIPCSH